MTGGGSTSAKPSQAEASAAPGGPSSSSSAADPAAATGFLTPAQRAALDAALASKKKGAPASDDGGGLFLRPRGSGGGGGGAASSKPRAAPPRRGSLDYGGGGGGGGGGGKHHERSHSGRHGAGNKPGRPKKGGAGGKWTWLGRDDDDLEDYYGSLGGGRSGGGGHGGGGGGSSSYGSHGGSYNRNGGAGAGMRLAARYLDERDPNFSDSEDMTAMPPPLSSSSSASASASASGGVGGGGGGGSSNHHHHHHHHHGRRPSFALHTDLESRLREYKTGLRSLIDEYFDSGDVAEAAASLAELGAPAFDAHFVKRLVGAALDRGAREREAASVLLSSLSGAAVPVAALERGFWELASAADDLELDVPGASSLIGTFLARAVVDDALPPAFVSTLPSSAPSPTRDGRKGSAAAAASSSSPSSSPPNPAPPPPPPPTTGAAAVRAFAEAALSRPHAAEALSGDACWGDAGATHAGGYAATRAAVAHILSDFLEEAAAVEASSSSSLASSASASPSASSLSAACALASKRFSELRSPFCGHELVKQAVLAVADAADAAVNSKKGGGEKEEKSGGGGGGGGEGKQKPLPSPTAAAAAVRALLSSLAESGAVSRSQMSKGFERVEARMPQLGPEAAAAAEELAADAEKGGWLLSEPERESGSNGTAAAAAGLSSSSRRAAPFDADAPPPPHVAAASAVPPAALAKFKASALVAWDEYFCSGDVDALAAALSSSAASAARACSTATSTSTSSSAAAAQASANGAPSPPAAGSSPPSINAAAFSWAAVKVGVRLACDRRAAEREACSVALASLVGDVPLTTTSKGGGNSSGKSSLPKSPVIISHEAAATGFLALLDAAEDLALDVPEAPRLLSLFAARAVVDEVLPPSFLADAAVPALRPNSLGIACVAAAGAFLGARHAAERALGCWSVAGGALKAGDRSALGLRGAMRAALDEFSLCGAGDAAAVEEVAACLRELQAPFYHHEFVKQVLTAAATASAAEEAARRRSRSSADGGGGGGGGSGKDDDNADDADDGNKDAAAAGGGNEKLTPAESRLLDLLARLTATGEVSQTQAARGAARFRASVDDLTLDCPGAKASAARLERGLVEKGIVAAAAAAAQ